MTYACGGRPVSCKTVIAILTVLAVAAVAAASDGSEAYSAQTDGRTFYEKQIEADPWSKAAYADLLKDISEFRLDVSYTGTVNVTPGTLDATKEHYRGEMSKIMSALEYEHPEFFWFTKHVSLATSYSLLNGTLSVTVTANTTPEFGDTPEKLKTAWEKIAEKIDGISAKDLSRPETVRNIHDRITEYGTYDHSQPPGYGVRNIYRTFLGDTSDSDDLQPHKVVCEGYAKAFKAACDRFGIPCITVSGDNHMFNFVQMTDGDWYLVDTTWDDDDSEPFSTYFLKGYPDGSHHVENWADLETPEFSIVDYRDSVTFVSNDGVDRRYSGCNAPGAAPYGTKMFKEWNTKEDGSGTSYAEGEFVDVPENESLVLYAIYGDAGGNCGNYEWSIVGDGELRIAGTGAVTSKGWESVEDFVRKVVVEEGITDIDEKLFENLDPASVQFPSTLSTSPSNLVRHGFYDWRGTVEFKDAADILGHLFELSGDRYIRYEEFTATFKNGSETVSAFTKRAGTPIEPPALVPQKTSEGFISYVFEEWEGYKEGDVLEGDKVFKAKFGRLLYAEGPSSVSFSDADMADIRSHADSDGGLRLKVKTGVGYAVFDNSAVMGLAGGQTFSIERGYFSLLDEKVRNELKNGTVYTIDFGDNNAFPDGSVTVTVPFILASMDQTSLKVYHVDGGEMTEMEDVSFSDGLVSFKTDHFSVYAIHADYPPEKTFDLYILGLVAVGIVGILIAYRRG